jgi:hypothetical protein
VGIVANYLRITPDELVCLQQSPATIGAFLYDDRDGDLSSRVLSDRCLDIDKTWHIIHFLLTGTLEGGSWPLCGAVLGGRPLGSSKVGYGSVRYLRSEKVREVAAALGVIPSDELARRFDLETLQGLDIYPGIGSSTAEELDYILPYYSDLVDFFQQAAEAGDALLLFQT